MMSVKKWLLMMVSCMVNYLNLERIRNQIKRIWTSGRDNEMFRVMVECMQDQPITVHDMSDGHRVIYANATACKHFGVDLQTLLSWTPIQFDPHANPELLARIASDWRNHSKSIFESEHRIATGEIIPVEVSSYFFEHDGRNLALCLTHDLRPSREAQARMLELERLQAERIRARRLTRFAQSALGVMYTIEKKPNGKIAMKYVSPVAEDILGVEVDVLLADDIDNLNALILPVDLGEVMRLAEESYRTVSPFNAEYRIQHPSKGVRWLSSNSVPDPMEDGATLWHGFINDITERKRVEELLAAREQEFRALVEHSPDTITRYNKECRRIYANPKMRADAGVPVQALLYKTPAEFPGGKQAGTYNDKIRQVLDSGEPGEFELTWHTGNNNEVCSHIRLTPEFDADGEVVSVLAVGRDITEMDAYRKQIHNLAFFDTLTNLPNRALLNERISKAIADASSHGRQFSLMLLDLDRFKDVNDTLGHGMGDLLLCEAGARLLDCVRTCDTVARLGGDEFAILLPEIRNSADLATIAQKILSIFRDPFIIENSELFVSTSIGIALYPDDSGDVDALFSYADSAMYHAKKHNGNNFQFYSMDLTETAAERMTIENDLRKALGRNELKLYYQPQVELETGETIGAEALIRWNHCRNGMVPPDVFIPVAEQTGLIIVIGEWVLLNACQAAVAWNAARATPFRVAVNLSTRQFIRNDLVDTIRRILSETGCEPAWLKLEITESLLLEDSRDIANMLETLNNMGLAISIDDFGTGYSALSYLNRFPVSQIKIDRSFVQGIPADHNKTELVKAMISIAQALDMELVAEGVETREQADCLQEKGCSLVQGYFFGKPMPRSEFEVLLTQEAFV